MAAAAAEEPSRVEADEDTELDLSSSDVCTKYREAGRIANLALDGVIAMVR